MNVDNKIKKAIENATLSFEYDSSGFNHQEGNIEVYATMQDEEIQDAYIAVDDEVIKMKPKYIDQIFQKLLPYHLKSIENENNS